ncbi:hypothetical protein Peur_008498 [Populus x canadensis]
MAARICMRGEPMADCTEQKCNELCEKKYGGDTKKQGGSSGHCVVSAQTWGSSSYQSLEFLQELHALLSWHGFPCHDRNITVSHYDSWSLWSYPPIMHGSFIVNPPPSPLQDAALHVSFNVLGNLFSLQKMNKQAVIVASRFLLEQDYLMRYCSCTFMYISLARFMNGARHNLLAIVSIISNPWIKSPSGFD